MELQWFNDYLKQHVKEIIIQVLGGIPQGRALGPLLYMFMLMMCPH